MRGIAIIGAGELGGTLAHAIARRDLARRVRLVDSRGRLAEGKALDIAQAAALEGFATQVSGARELASAAGCDVLVIADPPGTADPDGSLRLLNELRGLLPSAVVVCAAAEGRELVDQGARDLGLDRRRIFGTAAEALASAARALVALALDASPRDVALSVLGTPPAPIVLPWTDAAIGGYALTKTLSEPDRRRLADRIGQLWPPGPHALAAACVRALEAMCGRSRGLVSCFVAPDRSAGSRTRTAALPVKLDRQGIAEVVMPALEVVDAVALENALQI